MKVNKKIPIRIKDKSFQKNDNLKSGRWCSQNPQIRKPNNGDNPKSNQNIKTLDFDKKYISHLYQIFIPF